MPLRLLHTADWHLGQSFHDQTRESEHRLVLDWLLEVLTRRALRWKTAGGLNH